MSLENDSAEFIKKFEGYISKAKWDVNAYRIGHGSDTITLPDGSYRKVVKGDTTTTELAKKDLERRIKNEFVPKVEKEIGEPYWSKLPQPAKVGLISLAYNYGGITKKEIVDAARSGDLKQLSKAIVDSTYNDNKKLPESVRTVLRERRALEAGMVQQTDKIVEETKKDFKIAFAYGKRNFLPITLVVVGFIGVSIAIYVAHKNGGLKKILG